MQYQELKTLCKLKQPENYFKKKKTENLKLNWAEDPM